MTSGSLPNALLPLVALLFGAAFGLLSSLLLERRRQANGVAIKIVEVYLEVRRDLCGQLSDLAVLRADTVPDADELLLRQDAVANLLYRYYDFMPKRVLQEMNCLYACLGDKENRIYAIRNDELRLANEDEVATLVTEISLVGNSKYYALVPLRSANRDTRRAASIKYQARGVLKVVNQDLTIQSLLNWSRSLRK